MVMLQSAPKPQLNELAQIPWHLWLGGLIGVYAISMSIYTAPKMGFLILSGLVIFGQLLMSMLLDHFGWLGVEKIRLTGSVYWVQLLFHRCITDTATLVCRLPHMSKISVYCYHYTL